MTEAAPAAVIPAAPAAAAPVATPVPAAVVPAVPAAPVVPAVAPVAAAAPAAPVAIVVKVDGMPDAAAAAIAADATAHGWSQEQAQKFAETVHKRHTEGAAAADAAEKAAIDARNKAWAETMAADTEFGGAKLAQTTAQADAAFERFGDAEFKALLAETGFAACPAVLRVFAKIGRAIADDSFKVGGAGPSDQSGDMRALYPSMPNR